MNMLITTETVVTEVVVDTVDCEVEAVNVEVDEVGDDDGLLEVSLS